MVLMFGSRFDFSSKMDNIDVLSNFRIMSMQVVTSGKVQSNFGQVAEIAKFGEPVTITQYGRPTLLLMRYQDGMSVLEHLAKQKMVSWLDGRKNTASAEVTAISEDELNALINEEIKK